MNESDDSAVPPEVVEAFTAAAGTALQELTQVEAFAIQAAQIMASPEESVVATLSLLRHVPGSLSLVLTTAAAVRLATLYLPEKTELTEEIVDDVVGEFANVIAGQSKTVLKGTPYHYTLSTPVVARVANFGGLPEIAAGSLIATLVFETYQLSLILDLRPCRDA